MNTTVKRLSALFICIVMLVGLCSCGSDEKERAEFSESAPILLEYGVDVCRDIYLGGGLPADTPDAPAIDYTNGTYYPVSDGRYTSVADIKNAAEKAFTPQLAAQWLYPAAFEGDVPLYKDKDGALCVNIASNEQSAFGVEWLYDTVEIVSFDKTRATVTVETIVGGEEGHIREVSFENTPIGWRISSPLFGEGVKETVTSDTAQQQQAAAENATSISDLLG